MTTSVRPGSQMERLLFEINSLVARVMERIRVPAAPVQAHALVR